ncbi:MAG TPA: antitoxin [Casimicrobiaceae bacterium]
MRTTLDIADDVLQAAKERARRENKSAGEVISELARAALTGGLEGPDAAKGKSPAARFGFRPFPKRGGIVTNDLIDSLREDDVY